EYGDYVSGPRVVTDDTKKAMKEVLTDIQNGNFDKSFIDDNKNGFKEFHRMRKDQQGHQIEKVGAELREMMPFVKPQH
ncbi:ketol-acid reductoisomerase, partial [Listeria monocytogenes]|nr:ketol-acid reductoisomerase [Listeria monocytogenes]